MLNVLISQPNIFNHTLYLPYIWGILKSYSIQDEIIRKNTNWLKPIFYKNKNVFEDIRKIKNIDVIGISCYVWNTEFNFKVVKAVKEKNPNCLVVAGGPDVNITSCEYFYENMIDCVIKKDGEESFKQIIKNYIKNGFFSFENINQIVFPHKNELIFQNREKNNICFDVSPYVHLSDDFEQIICEHKKENKNSQIWMPIETNRGCPYSCSFCDWGSNTMSKIRQFPLERIYAELDWMGKHDISHVMINDANFGIFKRDIKIAEKISEIKKNRTKPLSLYFSPAKNNVNNVIEISKIFYKNGLINSIVKGIQHTDKNVLQNIDRQNISLEKQKDMILKLKEEGVPVFLQLIYGSPGDTFDKWVKCLTDLIEDDMFFDYRSFSFNLLPNSPAANQNYKEKFSIKTIKRYAQEDRRRKNQREEDRSKVEHIISTYSYNEKDWIDMTLFNCVIQTFHIMCITKFISIYLNKEHNIPYYEYYKNFYNYLNDEKCKLNLIFVNIKDHINNFLTDCTAVEEIEIEDLNNYERLLNIEDYFAFKILQNLNFYWDDILYFNKKNYNNYAMDDILNFQKNILVTPDYDINQGRILKLKYNWIDYYSNNKKLIRTDNEIFINDKFVGDGSKTPITWFPTEKKDIKNKKFFECVFGHSSNRTSRIKRTYFSKSIKI